MIQKAPQLTGFITGCLIVALFWGCKSVLQDLSKPQSPERLSSNGLIDEMYMIHFVIPEDAYDIQYLSYGPMDYSGFCAFSVAEDDLKQIEATYADFFASEEREPGWSWMSNGVPMPMDMYQPVLWWPKEKGNLKTAIFERGWIGIDSANHRVYYHSFTT